MAGHRSWLISSGVAVVVAGTFATPAIGSTHRASGSNPAHAVSPYQIISVSVVPHSSATWALAAHPITPSKAIFSVLHRVGGRWSQHALPKPKGLNLEQIYAPSAQSIWLDGTLGHSHGGMPYIAHSTGGTFRRVKVPGVAHGTLNALGGSSTHDIWAVGLTRKTTPFALHYNGKAWTVVPFAGAPSNTGIVAVASSSDHNAWAIGEINYSFDPSPETFHWNGSSWAQVPIPNPDVALGSLATTSASHAWAVGSNLIEKSGRLVTYLLSWNGHIWTHEHTASPSSSDNVLSAVAAAGKRVWVVGYHDQGAAFENPIVERLMGTKWRSVPAPHIGRKDYLTTVGVSSRAVVGAGYYFPGSRRFVIGGSGVQSPLVEVPHGKHWAIQNAPR